MNDTTRASISSAWAGSLLRQQTQRGQPLMQFLVVRLGDGHIEPAADAVGKGTGHLPLGFQAGGVGQMQRNPANPDMQRRPLLPMYGCRLLYTPADGRRRIGGMGVGVGWGGGFRPSLQAVGAGIERAGIGRAGWGAGLQFGGWIPVFAGMTDDGAGMTGLGGRVMMELREGGRKGGDWPGRVRAPGCNSGGGFPAFAGMTGWGGNDEFRGVGNDRVGGDRKGGDWPGRVRAPGCNSGGGFPLSRECRDGAGMTSLGGWVMIELGGIERAGIGRGGLGRRAAIRGVDSRFRGNDGGGWE